MEQGQEREDSIYDFIYVDHVRVAQFLSQFGDEGSLTALTRYERVLGHKRADVGIKGYVERSAQSSHENELERHFDPKWILPLVLLDQLGNRSLIHRDITKAGLGQVVLCSGSLTLVDYSLIKNIWDSSAIRDSLVNVIENAIKSENRTQQQQLPIKPAKRAAILIQFLSMLPYIIQATLSTENCEVWCGLKQEAMLIPQAYIFLKYGTAVPGTWYALGIYDARPSEPNTPTTGSSPGGKVTDQSATKSLRSLAINTLGPTVKRIIGRPDSNYGMTPILLFREIMTPAVSNPKKVGDAATLPSQ